MGKKVVNSMFLEDCPKYRLEKLKFWDFCSFPNPLHLWKSKETHCFGSPWKLLLLAINLKDFGFPQWLNYSERFLLCGL